MSIYSIATKVIFTNSHNSMHKHETSGKCSKSGMAQSRLSSGWPDNRAKHSA